MAEFKLEADETDVIKALDNIEKKLAEVGQTADATGKKIGEGLSGSEADQKRAAESLAAYTAAQEKLKAGAADRIAQNAKMKASLEQFRKEQAAMNAATDEGAKKNIAYGETLKETTSGLNANANATKSAEGATKGATLAQRAWNLVMSANPIGIIIAAIVLLVNQLRKYQGVIDTASKITSQIGAVFTVVTDRAISLGKAIYSLVTLDFAGFGKNMVAATDDFTGAVTKAWTAAGNLADATFALRDAQLAAALSTAKLQDASDRAQAAAQDESKNFNQRIEQLKKAIGLEAEIARIKLGFAAQDLKNAKDRFALDGGFTDSTVSREALLEKELAFNAAQNESTKTRISLLKQLNQLEKERLGFISKAIDDAQKLSDKIDVTLAVDPTDKAIIQINQGTTELVKAIQDRIDKINEVQKLRPLNDDEIALRQKLQDNIVDVIDDGEKRILAAILEGALKANALEDKIAKDKKDAAKLRGEEARAALKDILDLENARIDITEAEFANFIASLKARGVAEETIKTAQLEFSKRITAQRLEAELAYSKAILGESSGADADILRARIQEIEVLLEGLDIPAPKGKDGKPKTIFDLLGIKFDDPEQQQAFEQAVGIIMDSLHSLTQARVDEAQAAADAAQSKVDAAQEALDKELDIAEQGLANNVDLRKKDLDEAKKARDAALKEETKARKAQILLDSLGQSSGLITASVNIFASLSKIPFVGIPLAIGVIGLMLGAFAATKAKALKAAEPPKLRKGAKIIGRTHEQGGELRELEDKEQVVGAAESAGQDVFFDRLRKGKYKGLDLAAIAEGRGDYQSPISESAARTTALQARRDKATETMHYNAITRAYERGADKIVDAIKKKKSYAPWKGGYKEISETGHGTDTKVYQPSE
jgi:hypothetical protein